MVKKKLVVIGGGFAGVNFIKKILNSRTTRDAFEITLVDKNDYHLFAPALIRASGSKKGVSEIFDVVALKFNKIFKEKEVNIVKGEAREIDFKKKTIKLKHGYGYKKPTEYDYLVISAGSETNFGETSGAKECSIGFKNFRDVVKIKSQIEKIFETKPKRYKAEILVVGAGDTGCGLVGALVGFTNDTASKNGHPLNTVKFKLIQRGDKILSASSGWIRNRVQNKLNGIGVEIILKSEIESVKENKIILKNREVLQSDIVIWTSGTKPNTLVSGFDEHLKVSNRLHLDNLKNVYVIGDADGKGTAQSAIHQANYVAGVLKNKIMDAKIKKYKAIKSYTAIEIGENGMYVDLGILKIGGYFAVLIRRFIFVRYFTRLVSFDFAMSWLKKYRDL